jgi:hypothetical protein
MTATFHPGVTNCGGSLAASGCSCARTVSAEVSDVDLMVAPAAPVYGADEQAIRDWMPTADDATFSRLCSDTADWVRDAADPLCEAIREPDWSWYAGPDFSGHLGRTPHRRLPQILLDEMRQRQATDIGPDALDRARSYEASARAFFAYAPHHLGSPTTANEARGLWQGVQIGTIEDGRGFHHARFVNRGQVGDALSDAEAVRFAVEDTECARHAIEALRNGYRAGTPEAEQFTLRLASSPNRDVRTQIANAASWHDPLVGVMSADEDPVVRATVAGRMGLMAAEANRDPGAKDADLFQGHSAQNPRYQNRQDLIRISRNLARDPDTDVRRALATSTHWTDTKTPRTLAEDDDPMVRNVLAANARRSNLDEKTVKILTRDPKAGVRENLLASGVNISSRHLNRLLKDRDPAVAAAAARRLRGTAGAPALTIKDGRIQQGT